VKIAIVGGRGFIGSSLAKSFKDVLQLGKNDDLEKIKEVDVVINLAGATILKRWSKEYKKELFNSRINTTKKIVEIINNSNVKYFISTSAIGIYPNNCSCDEDGELGNGFLANLAKKWEEEALKCKKPASVLRLSVVLGKDGGAVKNMLLPFKLNLGGTIGRGCNFLSFIDIRDLIRIYKFLIENQLTGIFNASTPFYTTNYEFTKTLAKALNKKAPFIIPPLILKILYGEGAEVLLSSQKVYPKRLMEKGFEFKYPTIEKSLFSMFNHS